jgi:hypothetical protein
MEPHRGTPEILTRSQQDEKRGRESLAEQNVSSYLMSASDSKSGDKPAPECWARRVDM